MDNVIRKPSFSYTRQSVVGVENDWIKMWTATRVADAGPGGPRTVPEIMLAAGTTRRYPCRTRPGDLLHGIMVPLDGLKELHFMTIGTVTTPRRGTSRAHGPGPGTIFHADTRATVRRRTPSTGTASSPRR